MIKYPVKREAMTLEILLSSTTNTCLNLRLYVARSKELRLVAKIFIVYFELKLGLVFSDNCFLNRGMVHLDSFSRAGDGYRLT
jgi:hypothetical protein